MSSFVGRQRELKRLKRLIAEGVGPITITGPGGVGKTRLAMEFLARSGLAETSAVVAAEHCTSALALVSATARALGLETLGEADPANQIAVSMSRRADLVLVFDSVEHVIDEAAELLVEWRRRAPRARFVVTSRERLNVAGEHLVPLRPLGAEAVMLFVDRVRALKPDYAPDELELGRIRAIAEAVDGLPLALELAAAKARLVSSDALLTQLESSLSVLTSPARDRPPRHRTLEAAIRWTWALLDAHLKRVLSQLAVFAGPFTPEDAEAVVPEADLARLEALCDRSLLLPIEAGVKLLEHVRAFAWAALEEADRRAVRIRHAEHFARRAHHLARSPDWTEPISLSSCEEANFRAVLRRAVRADAGDAPGLLKAGLVVSQVWSPFRTHEGVVEEFDALVERLLARSADVPGLRAAVFQAALVACRTLRAASRLTRAQALLERAQAAATGDSEQAQVEDERSRLLWMQHRDEEALLATSRAEHLFRREDDRLALAVCWRMKASLYHEAGELERAIQLNRRCIPVLRSLGAVNMATVATANLAWAYLRLGRTGEARWLWLEAAEAFDQLGNRRGRGHVLMALGHLDAGAGALDAAVGHLTEALALQRRGGDTFGELRTLCNLGRVRLLQEELALARSLTRDARGLATQLGQPDIADDCELDLALMDWAAGEIDSAAHRIARLMQTHRRLGGSPMGQMVGGDVSRPPLTIYLGALQAAGARVSGEPPGDIGRRASADLAVMGLIVQALKRPPGWQVGQALGALLTALTEPHPERAGKAVRRAVPLVAQDTQIRFLLRQLWKALPAKERLGAWSSAFDSDVLLVGPDASSLRPPNRAPIDLRGRPLLARLIAHLVERRRTGRAGASIEALRRALWPNERMLPEAAKNRVFQALNRVKKLGLADRLHSGEDGYRLVGPLALVPDALPCPE
jgi:predicted ATPase